MAADAVQHRGTGGLLRSPATSHPVTLNALDLLCQASAAIVARPSEFDKRLFSEISPWQRRKKPL